MEYAIERCCRNGDWVLRVLELGGKPYSGPIYRYSTKRSLLAGVAGIRAHLESLSA